jgi:cell surface protein SprA
MRQFKNLEFFVHAEQIFKDEIVSDNDVTVFIRLGSDLTQNYYEYEIPAKISPWFNHDTTSIWPPENRVNIVLDSLVNVKQRRNIAVRSGDHISIALPYWEYFDDTKISVVGMPNLGSVTTMMIGVRNPKKRHINDGDDMLPKSVEVWIDELRLSGFDDRSGAAALGRTRLNLADVGDVALSGTITTPGYGALDQSVTQRQLATTYSVDFATNIDGGKVLFPQNWNIKIPIHYDFSMQGELPEYNPLNPDVKLKEDLKTYNSKTERDSIRRITNQIVRHNNLNLTNVRKERNMNKPIKMRPWDIENLDFTYAYAQILKTDVDMEFENQKRHEGEIGYNFSHNPKNYKVGQKKKIKSPWLQIIRDLNITPVPKSFSLRTSIVRDFNEFKYRPKSQGNIIMDTCYVKTFNWMRTYTLQWDITTSLKFTYNASATARLEEPQGLIDTRAKKDSIWHSFGKGGRMNFFDQRFDLTYQIPINKIPLFSWISSNFRYSGQYKFSGAPISLARLGNTIENSNQIALNGQVDFIKIYNFIPYLKKINSPAQQKPKTPANNKSANDPKDKKNKTEKDSLKSGTNYGKIIGDGILRFLMMVRNANLSWSQGKGSLLPGYMPAPDLFGINFKTNSPGFLYVFGGQPNIRRMAVDGNWISKDTSLNTAFQEKFNQTINFRALIEPFKDFRIDVVANRTYTSNTMGYLKADANGKLHPYSLTTTGNFNITYIGLNTLFKKAGDIFDKFRDVRAEIAKRLANDNPNSVGMDSTGLFPSGYNTLSQEVLMYSFMTAYMGKDVEKMNVQTPFLSVPLPNWQLRYQGLTKIKAMAKVFQAFSINHSYTCTYTIGNYKSNLRYATDPTGHPNQLDPLGNFIPEYEIAQISMMESFKPVIGFDMTLTNSLMFKVQYDRSRNLSLSFANNQLTEMALNEISISAGYRFKDLKLGIAFAGTKRQIVSDLTVALGFSMRDNTTTLRKIAENVKQVTSGMLNFTINATADYQVSTMVGLQLYYKQMINKPYVDNQFQNSNLEAGICVKLLLTQ